MHTKELYFYSTIYTNKANFFVDIYEIFNYILVVKEKILVVDDEFNICDSIKDALQKDYFVNTVSSGEEALEILEKELFDLILLDLGLPGINGIDLLKQSKEQYPQSSIIIITATDSAKSAVDCMKLGASDYISKPFELDELKICVKKALEDKRLRQENTQLKEEINKQYVFENIIGESLGIREVCKSIHQATQNDSSVLILGETGTGKELVSKTIHYNSLRKSGPFKAINCGAIPKDLLESELFGYEKGAFTGASQTKPGLVELANLGTLFLDEIAELQPSLQVKLLRFLEEKIITRVGGTKEIKVDIRLICATNKDQKSLIKENKFRKDLYYRINVFPIHIPLLRERKEDIPLLVNFFLKEFEENFGIQSISQKAISSLKIYNWPGNVRELKNILERILISNQNRNQHTITSEHIPEEIYIQKSEEPITTPDEPMPLEKAVNNLEQKLIKKALKNANGNITRAAQLLGTSYRILKYKMDKLGIK